MGGMKHQLAFEFLQIQNTLPIIHTSGNSFVLFHLTLPSSSPLDQTPHWTYTTEPMLTEWRFLGSPRRAVINTSRMHYPLSYPLTKYNMGLLNWKIISENSQPLKAAVIYHSMLPFLYSCIWNTTVLYPPPTMSYSISFSCAVSTVR